MYFKLLHKQWYQSFIDLITYNIAVVLSIIAWHLIRDHLDRKCISYLSLPIEGFGCSLFLTNFKNLLLLIHFYARHIRWSKKKLLSQFFYLFFLVFRNTPISWWMPSNRHCLFFRLHFLGLPFFITFVPFNNLIMLCFYLLFCHKQIRDIVQQPWIHPHCLIVHFLCFKVNRSIPQIWSMVGDLCYLAWNNHIYLCLWTRVRVKFYGKKPQLSITLNQGLRVNTYLVL